MNAAADQNQRTTSFDLVVPRDPELLRVVRLVASGLASFTDLGLDGVERVRVAADELVSSLIQAPGEGPVQVTFAMAPECLTVTATAELASGSSFLLDALSGRILTEVASSHDFRTDGDQLTGRIEIDLPAVG